MNSKQLTEATIRHYENNPREFWEGTKDHDVSQNYNAFLAAIQGEKPFDILDFGCGPGRDLKYFSDQGHRPIGLDGCAGFCEMARKYSGCEVLQQNFIDVQLEPERFHGVFANASLFHVPKEDLSETISRLHCALKPAGILFSSNPRGSGDGMSGSRYGNFMELEEYQRLVEACGFTLLNDYYRPDGIPVEQRPWLATVFRKTAF